MIQSFFSLFVKKSLMRKLTIVGTFCVVAQLAIAQNVTSKKLDTIVIKKQMAVVDNVLKIQGITSRNYLKKKLVYLFGK